jgi:hypothetical protein
MFRGPGSAIGRFCTRKVRFCMPEAKDSCTENSRTNSFVLLSRGMRDVPVYGNQLRWVYVIKEIFILSDHLESK